MIFWDHDAILLFGYLPKGETIIAEGVIEGYFEGKTPRNVNKVFLFLHNSALAHRTLATENKLAYLCFECLDHPPYSPDLVPSHYHLFPGLKKQLNVRNFSSDAEVFAAAEILLDGQISDFFEWLSKFRATRYEVYRVSWGIC